MIRHSVSSWGTIAVVCLGAGACTDSQRVVQAGKSLPTSHRIVVGPEIRVSREGDRPHVETHVAANPRNVNNLVATSMVTGPRGFSAIVFSSRDGGNTWTAYEPPRLQATGASDPLVAFGPTGTAYFLPYVSALIEPPRSGEHHRYDLYRSEDRGLTWALAQTQAAGGDHPMVAVDLTGGRHRGNLYVVAPGKVFRSTNDGRTIADTFSLTPGFIVNGGVVVLSDGALVVALSPDAGLLGEGSAELATVTSANAGASWSTPAPVTVLRRNQITALSREPRHGILPSELSYGRRSFTADTATRSKYRDRIYLAWTDIDADRSRVLVSSSSDRGTSWTTPVPISSDEATLQFLPTMATNKDGVLGILYCDTRGVPRWDAKFNVYFTASIDGGATFLTPRVLSSQSSVMTTQAHGRPLITHASPYADSVSVWMTSVMTKVPTGGDYLGLASDIAGTFHPLWVDSRSAVYQAYTARVAVMSDSLVGALGRGLEGPVPINRLVTLDIDPALSESAANVLRVPVRLRNLSSDTIWGPISVRIRAIAYRGEQPAASSGWKVLNADNGLSGVGASFDYSNALGDLNMLPPGGISSPVVWRASFPEMRRRLLRLQVDVSGRLRALRAPGSSQKLSAAPNEEL